MAAMKGRARNAVLLALSEEVITSDHGTMAVMDDLDVLYLGDLASQAWTLTGDLFGIKKENTVSMEGVISRFRQALDACAGVGLPLHPVMASCLLMMSLC